MTILDLLPTQRVFTAQEMILLGMRPPRLLLTQMNHRRWAYLADQRHGHNPYEVLRRLIDEAIEKETLPPEGICQ